MQRAWQTRCLAAAVYTQSFSYVLDCVDHTCLHAAYRFNMAYIT